MDELLPWRSRFPILDRSTYLISNSLGAMPRTVYDRVKEYADTWATEGVLAWEKWIPMVLETGDFVGRIINAPPKCVVMLQNVSQVMSVIASCFEYPHERNRVVYDNLNFPSVHYVWKAQEARGARVHLVKSHDGIHVPTDELLKAIDERTICVPISQVCFRSAFIQDAKRIIDRAHEVGAYVILDSYQAVGTIPVDVEELNVDFLCGGSVKWLCGGPGAAYLYVRCDLQGRFEPLERGWFSHARPFDFDMEKMHFADGIMRYMGGSPSVPALYAAQEGYKVIAEVGVEAIRAKSMRQTARLVASADEQGLVVNTPRDPAQRAGTVSVDFAGAEAVCKELIRRKYIVDYRPMAGIRISPHFYNTDEECDAVMKEIRTIREGR